MWYDSRIELVTKLIKMTQTTTNFSDDQSIVRYLNNSATTAESISSLDPLVLKTLKSRIAYLPYFNVYSLLESRHDLSDFLIDSCDFKRFPAKVLLKCIKANPRCCDSEKFMKALIAIKPVMDLHLSDFLVMDRMFFPTVNTWGFLISKKHWETFSEALSKSVVASRYSWDKESRCLVANKDYTMENTAESVTEAQQNKKSRAATKAQQANKRRDKIDEIKYLEKHVLRLQEQIDNLQNDLLTKNNRLSLLKVQVYQM